MAVELLHAYLLGDMTAYYLLDQESMVPELMLLPKGMEALPWEQKKQGIESLIQLKLVGDIYNKGYASGKSMRLGESSFRMKYICQEVTEETDRICIRTFCADDRGYEACHELIWKKSSWLESSVTFTNKTAQEACLEMLESFSLGGITPFTAGDAHDTLFLHRIRSDWSAEGRVCIEQFEDLGLEPSWGLGFAVRAERFGAVGSMPVHRFFPFALIEDRKNHVFWGAQLCHNASWQMEVSRRDESVSFSGGLADREMGHWMKKIMPGESFTTPTAILTVAASEDADYVAQRMTASQIPAADQAPECEHSLPMMFNEWCTTWGNPTYENIRKNVEVLKNKPFAYFMIDAGWYRQDGIPWDLSMGDYVPSAKMYPEGIRAAVQAIQDAGMKAGIWFEMESAGRESDAYKRDEHFLKRDGVSLRIGDRKFWDMRDPWTIQYLSRKVIDFLKENGFEYIKIDYNDTLGIGVDGAESTGEALRQNMLASYNFFRKMRQEIPNLVIENCASGGHRLEPMMMSAVSMASFSDAHECEEIPVIAAMLHRVIQPRQSQIWAVLRKEDSCKRIAYSVINTLLGRMCISGDAAELSEEQWKVVDQGMAFYQETSHLIKNGWTHFYGTRQTAWRHLKGYQAILRENGDEALVVLHTFDGELPDEICVEWKQVDKMELLSSFSDTNEDVRIEGNKLYWKTTENRKALALHLKK